MALLWLTASSGRRRRLHPPRWRFVAVYGDFKDAVDRDEYTLLAVYRLGSEFLGHEDDGDGHATATGHYVANEWYRNISGYQLTAGETIADFPPTFKSSALLAMEKELGEETAVVSAHE